MSIKNQTLAHFRHFRHSVPLLLCPFESLHKSHKPYTLYAKRSTFVEIALQITPFYAKQSQSQVGQN